MGVIRLVFFFALTLALAACATEEGLYLFGSLNKKCIANANKIKSPISWKQAKVIEITIRDGIYDPNQTNMKVGEPTILRIVNNDDTPRYFIDGEFLDSVVLAEVSVGGAKYDWPCISGITIGAGKKTELRLVPLTAGIYFPEGHPFWFLGAPPVKLGYIFVKG